LNNEVKKGFEEAADQVAKYFGWDNDKIIPNEKDNEEQNNCSLCGTENNDMLELENGDYICLKCYDSISDKEKQKIKNELKSGEDGKISQKNEDVLWEHELQKGIALTEMANRRYLEKKIKDNNKS
jgi:hypothetical protein